ncbi:hypothetical protein R3W88_024039 [Solanum pinnatisectum]|uniref:Uncharacterized protein n=1 Tax=Solanum pinnatisectum TaxID=50273 RepID=A0AAV9LZ78_9SOLN|nr:hypothetical protein R3W88_024039 [Solanum pinnatisectum]
MSPVQSNNEKEGSIYRGILGQKKWGIGGRFRIGTRPMKSNFEIPFTIKRRQLFLVISTHSERGKGRRALRINSLVLAARRGSISRYKDRGRDCFCCTFLLRL